MRALDRSVLAMKRRVSVLGAMVRARLRVEDLATPIRQCRTTPRSSRPLPRKASKAERDRCFVLHELTSMNTEVTLKKRVRLTCRPYLTHSQANAGSNAQANEPAHQHVLQFAVARKRGQHRRRFNE